MTPERLARDAIRVVDRVERDTVRRILGFLRVVERDALDTIRLAPVRPEDLTLSRVLRELRARQAIEQSAAAQRLLTLGRDSGPLADEFRRGLTVAYQNGTATARTAAVQTGVVAPAAALWLAARVDLEFLDALTRTTLTTLERVGEAGLRRLEDALVRGAVRGAGPRATARLVREAISTTRSESERIARTVFMRANNEARDATYRELGVEFVQYNATNDERTCEYCESRHGMVYKRSDAPEPPLHPNCRCVLIPWSESTPANVRGDAYYERSRADMADRREGDAVTPRARAPFEKADDRDAPAPVWAPDRGWL